MNTNESQSYTQLQHSLKVCMQEEIVILRELLALAENEQQVLLKNDASTLKEVNISREEFIEKLNLARSERMEILLLIASDLEENHNFTSETPETRLSECIEVNDATTGVAARNDSNGDGNESSGNSNNMGGGYKIDGNMATPNKSSNY